MRTPRPSVPAALAAAALLAALATPTARAQELVRVTDPANPIVTDTGEGCGASWVDLVGDGRLDLFIANGNATAQKNALYRNTRAGGFVRVVTGPVATDSSASIGATFGDYDRDGIADLFVSDRFAHGNFLYRGLGDTLFERVATELPATDVAASNSASWVDLDGDGELDLYVVNFQGPDFLYRNGGGPGYHFTRVDTAFVTQSSDLSIVGAWSDWDGDGRDDLFVGTGGRQSDDLYANHGGLFFTRTAIADGRATLGASWGDYDDDGWIDLVTAGYVNSRNVLYHNAGPPTFALVPVASPVAATPGNWVGSAWGDYDDDGDLDLYVAGDGGAGQLFRNDGPPGYGFTLVTTGDVATDTGNAFGCAWGDYDGDGRLDLVVARRLGQTNALYHNAGGTPNHWLGVRCRGTVSNTSAIGARVTAYAAIGGAPRAQHREVTSQTGYNSGNLDQHFGLGDAAVVDSVVVRWPSGRIDTWRLLPADTFVVLVEGAAPPLAVPGATAPMALAIAPASANPAAGVARVRVTLPVAAHARLDVFDVAGRLVATPLDGWRAAGAWELAVDPGARAGVYLCRLRAAGHTAVTRLVRLP